MLGAYNDKAGKEFYRAIPAMTRDPDLQGLRSVASYDKSGARVLRTYSYLDPQVNCYDSRK